MHALGMDTVTKAAKQKFSWREFIRLFCAFFGMSFIVGIGSYSFLHFVCGQRHVFGALFRMFVYHEQHPAEYLAVVASSYALFAAAWGVRSRSFGWRRHLGVLGVLMATLLLSSAVGGVLWHFHDMQAGHFPPWERRLTAFAEGISSGIAVGWLLVLLSFPLNVISVAFAYAAALYFPRRIRNT